MSETKIILFRRRKKGKKADDKYKDNSFDRIQDDRHLLGIETNFVGPIKAPWHWRQERMSELRRALMARDGGRCRWCGIGLHNDALKICGRNTTRATVDHLILKSSGGEDTLENTILSCSKCNTNRNRPSWRPKLPESLALFNTLTPPELGKNYFLKKPANKHES